MPEAKEFLHSNLHEVFFRTCPLPGLADLGLVQPQPPLYRSAASRSVSKISELWCLLTGGLYRDEPPTLGCTGKS
jgi:hypothetical protein